MKKVNGFTQSLHPFQIITYIYFIALLGAYFFIILPLSSKTNQIIGTILQVLTGIAVFVSGTIVTIIDPSDEYLIKTRKAEAEGKEFVPEDSDFYCSIDNSYVSESSKHCRKCGRCTEDFDHHCKWINNDIGKKNYKAFFLMIVSVMFLLVVFLVFGALLTADYIRDSKLMNHDISLYNHSHQQITIAMIVLWVIMGISSIFLILDSNLVFFHIYLIKQGITTFQYIVMVEERKDQRREMQFARKILGKKQRSTFDFILCLNSKKNKKQKKRHPEHEASDHNHQEREAETVQNTDQEEVHQPTSPTFGLKKDSQQPRSPPPIANIIDLNNRGLTHQKTDTEFFTKEDKSPKEFKHFFPSHKLNHKRHSVDSGNEDETTRQVFIKSRPHDDTSRPSSSSKLAGNTSAIELVKNTSSSKKINDSEAITEKDMLTDLRYEVYQMEGDATTPNQKQKKKQAIAQISIPTDNEINRQLKPQVSNHVKQVSFSSVPYDPLMVSPIHSEVASQKGLDASPKFIKKEIFLENKIIELNQEEKADDLEAGEESDKLQGNIQKNQLEVEDIA